MSARLEARVATPLREFDLDVTLATEPGRPLALVGPSGAGKTTVLRVIAGLLAPRSGRVSLGAETWLDTDRGVALAPERRRCGLLFQDYALFPRMNVWRNVAYGLRGRGAERRRTALEMLRRFGVDGLADADPGTLSGGERQRVALARTLAPGPGALLLDEPLSALDPETRRSSLFELRSVLASLDVPVILVTHSFAEAATAASALAVVDRGLIVQSGTPAEVSLNPTTPFVAGFTGASVIDLDGVTVALDPWDVRVEPASGKGGEPDRRRLPAQVESLRTTGSRTTVSLLCPQRLEAEMPTADAERAGLRPGAQVTASWDPAAAKAVG